MTPRFSATMFTPATTTVHDRSANIDRLSDEQLLELASLVASPADILAEADVPAPEVGGFEVFVPDHYEPNYAYPLLIWLETSELKPGEFARRMREVSDRNYLGVSVDARQADQLEEKLPQIFQMLRRNYHVNSERVYLLGVGESGTLALETGLRHPDWFAGFGGLSARWPESPCLLAQYDEIRHKRVFLGICEGDDPALLLDTAFAARLLWLAGAQVTTISTAATHSTIPPMFREIDRWAMQSINQLELVY
jgi:phospholipase/carboxylesterase